MTKKTTCYICGKEINVLSPYPEGSKFYCTEHVLSTIFPQNAAISGENKKARKKHYNRANRKSEVFVNIDELI